MNHVCISFSNLETHSGVFQGQSLYLPWSWDSVRPWKGPVNGPSGKVPAVDTRTDGHRPIKLPQSSCSGNMPISIERLKGRKTMQTHTDLQARKPVCPPLVPSTTQLHSCKSIQLLLHDKNYGNLFGPNDLLNDFLPGQRQYYLSNIIK